MPVLKVKIKHHSSIRDTNLISDIRWQLLDLPLAGPGAGRFDIPTIHYVHWHKYIHVFLLRWRQHLQRLQHNIRGQARYYFINTYLLILHVYVKQLTYDKKNIYM